VRLQLQKQLNLTQSLMDGYTKVIELIEIELKPLNWQSSYQQISM